jgi:hypothetical protein
MNAEGLLAHYEKIADAPDAIPRLRRFVVGCGASSGFRFEWDCWLHR